MPRRFGSLQHAMNEPASRSHDKNNYLYNGLTGADKPFLQGFVLVSSLRVVIRSKTLKTDSFTLTIFGSRFYQLGQVKVSVFSQFYGMNHRGAIVKNMPLFPYHFSLSTVYVL